jgi:hypothetical protein
MGARSAPYGAMIHVSDPGAMQAMAQELRERVKRDFYPYAQARGFVRARSDHPHFTVFRRYTADTVQVFSVQWDKHGAPRFVVNFGEGPKAGSTLWGKHIPGEALQPNSCRESGRLQRRRGPTLGCWFQFNKPVFEALRTLERRYSAEAVVGQLLAAFPEVEAWWQDRTVGPHLMLNSPDMWELAASSKGAS